MSWHLQQAGNIRCILTIPIAFYILSQDGDHNQDLFSWGYLVRKQQLALPMSDIIDCTIISLTRVYLTHLENRSNEFEQIVQKMLYIGLLGCSLTVNDVTSSVL